MQVRKMQTQNNKWLLLLAVLSFGAPTLLPPKAHAAPFKKGQKFPAFTLKTIGGKTISPASLKNKAYWITFFSSG